MDAFPFTRFLLHLFPALSPRPLYSRSLYLFLFLPFVPLNTALTLIATQQTDSPASPTSKNLLAFCRCALLFSLSKLLEVVEIFGSFGNLSFLYIYLFNVLLTPCIPFQRCSLMFLPHSYVRTAMWRLNTNQINMSPHQGLNMHMQVTDKDWKLIVSDGGCVLGVYFVGCHPDLDFSHGPQRRSNL